ncbi:MAG: class I SAM-dependent methyltransferase, partial [Candidatus Dormibacteraceae bacterium]
MSWDQQRGDNRAFWDELAVRHEGSDFYDLDGMRAGRQVLRAHELAELGSVRGHTLCHLQCHIGTDTLAWARQGAIVTGVDFSPRALDVARRLAADLDLPAEFVEADVYAAPEVLAGRTFDIVYTGYGALVWLPDLDLWALNVARLLRPGGILYVSEFHPFHEILADDRLEVAYDYFPDRATTWDDDGDYAGTPGALRHRRRHEWIHPLGEVVSAIAGAGLTVEFLHEREGIPWPRLPFLVQRPDGQWYP